MSGMDTRTFFDIMGTAPATVTVVTTIDAAGHPRGMTVAAVSSVSADPPSLLISVDRRSRTLPDLRNAGRFAVNYLRGDRAAVSQRFASPVADRFEGIEWRPGSTGMPILHADAIAWAECRIQQEIVSDDHLILIAAVEDGAPPPPRSRPLMYFRHHYEAWTGQVEDARRAASRAVAGDSDDPPTPSVHRTAAGELEPV